MDSLQKMASKGARPEKWKRKARCEARVEHARAAKQARLMEEQSASSWETSGHSGNQRPATSGFAGD